MSFKTTGGPLSTSRIESSGSIQSPYGIPGFCVVKSAGSSRFIFGKRSNVLRSILPGVFSLPVELAGNELSFVLGPVRQLQISQAVDTVIFPLALINITLKFELKFQPH